MATSAQVCWTVGQALQALRVAWGLFFGNPGAQGGPMVVTLTDDGGFRAIRVQQTYANMEIDVVMLRVMPLPAGEVMPYEALMADQEWEGTAKTEWWEFGLGITTWQEAIDSWIEIVIATKQAIINEWTTGTTVEYEVQSKLSNGDLVGMATCSAFVETAARTTTHREQMYARELNEDEEQTYVQAPPQFPAPTQTGGATYIDVGQIVAALNAIASKNSLVAINHGGTIFNASGLEVSE